MQRAPAYKQITQPVDLTGRIKPGFLQNSNASQIELARDFGFDISTWREKEDIYETSKHPFPIFQYLGQKHFRFLLLQSVELKFWKEKSSKKPREKNPTIVSSCKEFTDSNDLFCCCPTSLLVFLKIFRLHFMKCFQSPPCRSGHWAVNLVVG